MRIAYKCPQCKEVTTYYKPGYTCPYCGYKEMLPVNKKGGK